MVYVQKKLGTVFSQEESEKREGGIFFFQKKKKLGTVFSQEESEKRGGGIFL